MKRKFKVLYTHQKTKKKKTWQDGYLTLTIDEKRGFLTDEEKRNISTVYLNKKNVECGSALESDKYLIQVDDEIMSDSPQLSQQEKVVTVTKPPETPVTYSQNSQTVVKKSRGFSVPRKVVTHIPVPEVASAKFQPISAPVKVPEKSIWNEVLPLTEETTNLVNEDVNIGLNLRGTQDVLKMLGCTGPVNSVLKEVSSNVDPHVSDHNTQDSGLSDFFEELS
uniref:5'-3' DNA helicase ZGRF1-like N-terminal domain-containing protein n=1 Tax=Ciona intestinalis TaxID=7719 RepID=H2XWC2_CIOIN